MEIWKKDILSVFGSDESSESSAVVDVCVEQHRDPTGRFVEEPATVER